MMARVSIVLPTYNRAALLDRAIESVLAQTVDDWELVVVDDGSTDGTEKVVTSFDDPRIEYVHRPNGGELAATRTGLDAATGEYLGILHSDDAYTPDFLGINLALIDEVADRGTDEQVRMTSCGWDLVRADGTTTVVVPYAEPTTAGLIAVQGDLCMSNHLFLTAAVRAIGFDEHLRSYGDWDFLFRLVQTKEPHQQIVSTDAVGLRIHRDHDDRTNHAAASAEAVPYLLEKHHDEFRANRHDRARWKLEHGRNLVRTGHPVTARWWFVRSWADHPRKVRRLKYVLSPPTR